MRHDKDCGDIPSCSEGDRGEMTGREATINNIKHHLRDGQHFGGVSHQMDQSPSPARGFPREPRQKLPRKRERRGRGGAGSGAMGGRGTGKKLPETEKCIISKIGSPF